MRVLVLLRIYNVVSVFMSDALGRQGGPMFRHMQMLFALSLLLLIGCFSRVHAADAMQCPGGMEPTIASLRECVEHAALMGDISNSGVATSLLALLDQAAAAEARGNITAAVRILEAFVAEVRAQSGKTLDAAHAEHMIEHALMVIQALTT